MTAKKWIGQHQESPFFLYVHYNDPHRPYCPPIYEREKVSQETQIDLSPAEYPDYAYSFHERFYELIADGIPLSESEMQLYKSLYDGEIRHTDKWIGRLLEYILKNIPDTKVVITADHGELFGEGGMLGHSLLLHDALINVPMITYNFNELNHQTSELIQHIDIIRTILESLEVRTDSLEGKNLLEECRPFAVSQRSPGGVSRDLNRIREHNPEFETPHAQSGKLTAFRSKEHKLLVGEENTKLVSLTDEFKDISEEEPELKSEMSTSFSNWYEQLNKDFSRQEARISDSMKDQLEDLGYLG